MSFTDTWAELITLLILVAGSIGGFVRWLYVTHLRENTFTMHFDDGGIGKTLPVGGHLIDVSVAVSYPLSIERFNVRYVDSIDGGDVPASEVHIEGLGDRESVARTIRETSSREDRINGRDMHYSPALLVTPERRLLLRVKVVGKVPRDGYLSFRGTDDRSRFRFSRLPLTFVLKT